MKFDVSGIVSILIEQVAALTREEQRAFAQHLGAAVATVARSSRTTIDDAALRSIALPFAKDVIQGVETGLQG